MFEKLSSNELSHLYRALKDAAIAEQEVNKNSDVYQDAARIEVRALMLYKRQGDRNNVR